jgi:hypothetical protein
MPQAEMDLVILDGRELQQHRLPVIAESALDAFDDRKFQALLRHDICPELSARSNSLY